MRKFLELLFLALLAVFAIVSVQAQAQALPDHPQQQHVADKKFWMMQGVNFAATMFDAKTTVDALKRPNVQEANFFYGSNPSAGRVYGQSLALTAGTGFLAYELKKHHVRTWWLFPLTSGAVHIGAGFHNRSVGN